MHKITLTQDVPVLLSSITTSQNVFVQNQNSDIQAVHAGKEAPFTEGSPTYIIWPHCTEVLDNSAGDLWIMTKQKSAFVLIGDGDKAGIQVVDFSSSMLTPAEHGYQRLRVEDGQTGFYSGKFFEIIRKVNTPKVYKFVCPCPIIIHKQELYCSEGDIELFAWSGSDVVESGTWASVPQVWRQNDVNQSYARQVQVFSGGTITSTNSQNYRDYARAKTSGATAQQATVAGISTTERYHLPGIFYVELKGVGVGSYNLSWEEREY